MNEKMRILLADDDTEFCARMSAVLDSADDFELVGIAETAKRHFPRSMSCGRMYLSLN